MSAATFYTKLNSSNRFGRLACGLALLPMLLWPSLARAECCCPALVAQSQVKLAQAELANIALSESVEGYAGGGTQPLERKSIACCPQCITSPQTTINNSPPGLASLTAHCDCQTHLLASFISPRAEISSTDYRTISFPSGITAISAVIDRALLAMSGKIPVRLSAPTANQRRAILCCWLN